MNKEKRSLFGEEVRKVLSVPDLDQEFDAQLEQRLLAKMRNMQNQKAASATWNLRRYIFSIPMLVVVILSGVIFAIGPQRVLAAVRGFGFLPGIGYVQDDVRVLDEPVQVQREDVAAEVFEGISDSESTWLRVAITGRRVSTGPMDEDCRMNPYLDFDDDEFYYPEWSSMHGGEGKVIMEISFPVIPSEIENATLVLPCIPAIPVDLNLEDWVFSLKFRPPTDDEQPLPAEPVFVPTTVVAGTDEVVSENEPSETPANELGAQLVVENVVELSDGYQFQGYVLAPDNPNFSFNSNDLSLLSSDGEIIEIAQVDMPFGSNMPAGAQPWVVRTNTKDLSKELTFTVNALGMSHSDETVTSQSISFDMGSSPQDGQKWTLDQTIQVAGIEVKFIEASLDQITEDVYLLFFWVEYPQDEIYSMELADVDNQFKMSGGGGGGGGGSNNPNFRLETTSYSSLPSGIRTIYVAEADIVQEIDLSTTIELPEK